MKNKKTVLFTFIYVITIISILSTTHNKNIVLTRNSNIYAKPANKAFDNFYKCVVDQYNSDNSKKISYKTNLTDKQLNSIIGLYCDSKKIKSAKGIEKLSNIIFLSLDNNQLTELDVSKNKALTTLTVSSNNLKHLNVSKNTALKELFVYENNLTELDVSKNTALEKLIVFDNNLTELDVSKNTALTTLNVSSNNLKRLNVSKNTALTKLFADDNNLKRLNISQNYKLEELEVSIEIGTYKNKNKLIINVDIPKKMINKNLPDGVKFNNDKLFVDRFKAGLKLIYFLNKNDTFNKVTYHICVIEATSNQYKIDEEKEKIYITDSAKKQTILDNIKLNYGTKEIKNDKLIIKYNDEVVKKFKLVYKVSGVSLDQSSIDMKKNATVQLNATVSPKNATNKKVIWTSDNNLVATVSDNGLVKAKNAGSAVITATTDDGKKTAKAKINVERPNIVDDGIPRLNIYTYNSKSISDGQYAPINPSGLEYKVYNTKKKCESDIDGAIVSSTVDRTSWNMFVGEKNTKLDNNSLYMEAKIFGAPVGTDLYIKQSKVDGYELNNECRKIKVGETNSITFSNKPSKNNKYYNIKIDNSLIKKGTSDIKAEFYGREKVSIYDDYQEIRKDDYIFLGWKIQRKSDKKYMCYKDQNHTSFDWLDENNCGNGIILLQNNGDLSSYLTDIKNKETIILKSDWQVPSTIKIELKDTNNQKYKRHATVMLYNDKKQCLQDFQTNTYQQAKAASSIEQGQYGWISKNSQKSNDIETNDGIISIKKQLSDKNYYLLVLVSNYYNSLNSNCIKVKAGESKTIKLTPKKFKINYNLSGGTGTVKTVEKTVDKDVTIKVKNLKYTNYKLDYWKAQRKVDNKTEYRCYNKDNKKGWYLAKDCHSYIKYGTDGKDFNMTINTPGDSITFVAQWKK